MFLVQSCGLTFGCLMFACFTPLSVAHNLSAGAGWVALSPSAARAVCSKGPAEHFCLPKPLLCMELGQCPWQLPTWPFHWTPRARMWCRLVLGWVCWDWSGFDSFYLCFVAMRKWTLITGQSLPVTISSQGTTLFWDFIHTKPVIWFKKKKKKSCSFRPVLTELELHFHINICRYRSDSGTNASVCKL